MSKISIAVSAAAGLSALVLAGPALSQTTLLFNGFAPHAGQLHLQIVAPYLAEIEKVTAGRVKIKLSPQNLAPPPEQMNMVKSGIADGAFMLTSFLQKSHPPLQLVYLPGTSTRPDVDAIALQRTYEKFFKQKNPVTDVVHVGFFAGDHGGLYNMQKMPVQSVAEFKGKKVWALPGLTSQAIGVTGAAVVPGPAVRMHEIISKGVVDMFCCVDMEHLNAVKISQYLGAITDIEGGLFGPKFTVFFNKSKWGRISKADQKAILEISADAMPRRALNLKKVSDDFRQQYIAKGVVAAPASAAFSAELKKLWQPMYDAYFKSTQRMGIDGKAALEFYRSEAKKLAAGG
ncbi:MAG: TRAP transporter substrate-binding protein DctP [Beijerinckiaceae bacterium]|nr:TRAP transporter substrate-binding protein DctP [Beijerinckiaceae bacterium]